MQVCVHALVGPGQAPRGVEAAWGADPRRVRRGRAGACGQRAAGGRVCVCVRVSACECMCTRARVRAQACVPSSQARGETMLGALRPRGSQPDPPPPMGPVSFSIFRPRCSSHPPRGGVVGFGFFPPPWAVSTAVATEAGAPGLWARRLRWSASGPSGHCTAATAADQRLCLPPATFFFFFFCELDTLLYCHMIALPSSPAHS